MLLDFTVWYIYLAPATGMQTMIMAKSTKLSTILEKI